MKAGWRIEIRVGTNKFTAEVTDDESFGSIRVRYWDGQQGVEQTVTSDDIVRKLGPNPTTEQRQWRDKSGKFSIQATLDQIHDDQVRLKKTNGSTINVKRSALSSADNWYLDRAQPLIWSDGRLPGQPLPAPPPTVVPLADQLDAFEKTIVSVPVIDANSTQANDASFVADPLPTYGKRLAAPPTIKINSTSLRDWSILTNPTQNHIAADPGGRHVESRAITYMRGDGTAPKKIAIPSALKLVGISSSGKHAFLRGVPPNDRQAYYHRIDLTSNNPTITPVVRCSTTIKKEYLLDGDRLLSLGTEIRLWDFDKRALSMRVIGQAPLAISGTGRYFACRDSNDAITVP